MLSWSGFGWPLLIELSQPAMGRNKSREMHGRERKNVNSEPAKVKPMS